MRRVDGALVAVLVDQPDVVAVARNVGQLERLALPDDVLAELVRAPCSSTA